MQALRALPAVGLLGGLADMGAADAVRDELRLAVLVEQSNDLSLRLPDERVGDLEGMAKLVCGVACLPDPTPGVRSESGYFRSLSRRCGDGTEGEVDGGDHRVLA